MFQFYINCGAQYLGLTLGEATDYIIYIGSNVLLVPVKELETGYQYMQAAQKTMEKRARIIISIFLITIFSLATLTDSETNATAVSYCYFYKIYNISN